jgi:hypothetical protein
VFRASDIFYRIDINSQGIIRSATTPGFLRMADEDNQLKVFVSRNDDNQEIAFKMELPKKDG